MSEGALPPSVDPSRSGDSPSGDCCKKNRRSDGFSVSSGGFSGAGEGGLGPCNFGDGDGDAWRWRDNDDCFCSVTGGGSGGSKCVDDWGTGTADKLAGNTGVAGGVGWGVGLGVGLTTTTRGKSEDCAGGVDGSRTDGTTVGLHGVSLGFVREGVEIGIFTGTIRIGSISQIILPTLVFDLA